MDSGMRLMQSICGREYSQSEGDSRNSETHRESYIVDKDGDRKV